MTPAGLYIGACQGLVVCKGLVLDCTSADGNLPKFDQRKGPKEGFFVYDCQMAADYCDCHAVRMP